MNPIDVTSAQTQLPLLVDAALNGEQVILVTPQQRRVQLIPVPNDRPSRKRQFGAARGKISMSADFDAPLDDFSEYTQ